MRARSLMLLALAACSPDIADGGYLCGPEQTCPSPYVCSGSDFTCVEPEEATPFGCGDLPNTPATAVALNSTPLCVQSIEANSCIGGSGDVRWFSLATPPSCAKPELGIAIELQFPEAWAGLQVTLADAAGNALATDAACSEQDVAVAGTTQTCITTSEAAGSNYLISVEGTGDGDCGGACAYNDFTLTTALSE